jgi:hypothetical protein
VKALERNLITSFESGYVPPGIFSYVVAYKGPARIGTVHEWIRSIENTHGLNAKQLPLTRGSRNRILSEGIEGVFVLGQGSVIFDNAPISLIWDETIARNPEGKYQITSYADGNLLWLFLMLAQAASNTTGQWANLIPYIKRSTWNYEFL